METWFFVVRSSRNLLKKKETWRTVNIAGKDNTKDGKHSINAVLIFYCCSCWGQSAGNKDMGRYNWCSKKGDAFSVPQGKATKHMEQRGRFALSVSPGQIQQLLKRKTKKATGFSCLHCCFFFFNKIPSMEMKLER